MAESPQHTLQIMETQTRFDLNAAIQSWQQELTAQPNLASDVRRELETHLRDSIAGLRQRGLNDEESFWLARRRVGQPAQLDEEFEKADPAKVWHKRIFWMAVGSIGSYLFGILLMLILSVSYMKLDDDIFLGIGYDIALKLSWLGNAVCPLAIVLILFFTPKQNRKVSKRKQIFR